MNGLTYYHFWLSHRKIKTRQALNVSDNLLDRPILLRNIVLTETAREIGKKAGKILSVNNIITAKK